MDTMRARQKTYSNKFHRTKHETAPIHGWHPLGRKKLLDFKEDVEGV